MNQTKGKNNLMYNIVYPLKVVEEGKSEHFDLLMLSFNSCVHYTYIKNFSRLVSKQNLIRSTSIVL